MTIRKSISFFAPYIVNELNQHVDNISGGDALLYGGEITVQTSSTVDIAPYIFVQGGVTVFQDEVTAGVTVPDYSSFTGPVHILVASPDSTDASGVTMSVSEGSEDIDDNAIVLASRSQNVWSNPPKPSLIELRKEALLSRADSSYGRISDAGIEFDDGYIGWGTNQAVHLKQGVVADSAGSRRVLGVDTSLGESNSSFEFDITSVDPDFRRDDYIVARRISDNLNAPPEIVYAKGDTYSINNPHFDLAPTPFVAVHTSAGNTTPSVAYNATGEHVIVYGNSTNLYHAKLDHTASRTVSVGPTATAAGGTVSDVVLAERKDIQSGDRLYGCCIIGTELAVFRTAADGASIGVSDIHIFTSMSNTPAAPHMVVTGEGTTDKPLYAHIVFEHPEGSPNNQIYYTKYALADATWGTAGAVAVQPRIARGFNSGHNHTDPYIAAHPNGELHIAYVHAAGSATVGEIRYLVINQAGEVVEIEQALATGITEVNDGTGTGITLNTNLEMPKVVISPQGSVYVVYADSSGGVLTDNGLIAWEPTMLERTGFHAVVLRDSIPGTFQWHSAFSDDLGNLCCIHTSIVAGDSDETTWAYLKFQPVLVSDGISIDPDSYNVQYPTGYLDYESLAIHDNSDGEAKLDRDGSISVANLYTNTIEHIKISSMSRADSFYDKRRPHPKDEYLAHISIPSGASNTISSGGDVHPHPKRIKTLPPFKTVGLDGDSSGFSSLQEAIWSLRGVGGRIIIRGGEYEFLYPIEVVSGVELIGDGHVTLVMSGYNQGLIVDSLNYLSIITVDATRRIYGTSGGSTSLLQRGRVGDMAFLWNWSTRPVNLRSEFSEPIVITKILSDSNFQVNRDISSEMTSLGANARLSIYSTGTKLQNLTIYDNRNAGLNQSLVEIDSCYMGLFKDLHLVQTQGVDTVMIATQCYATRFENVVIDKTGSNACFALSGGDKYSFDVSLSHCSFRGDVYITDTCTGTRVDGCSAENWNITTVADAPTWTNNRGTISETTFDSTASWADDASVFANRIVMNEDSGFLTSGNVRGNLVPVGSASAVGSLSKKWQDIICQSALVRPSATGIGVEIIPDTANIGFRWSAENFDPKSDVFAEVLDWRGDSVNEVDGLGQWVGVNSFEDDFMYIYQQWLNGGAQATSKWPDEKYATIVSNTPDLQTTSSASIPTNLRHDSGGVIEGKLDNNDAFWLIGPQAFSGGWLSSSQKIVFKVKHSFGYQNAGSELAGFLHRTDKFGFIDTSSNYIVYIEYANTSTPAPYPLLYLVVEDGVNPAVKQGLPNSEILMDTWRVYYIAIDSSSVTAWADGASTAATINFSSNPNAPASTDAFAPFWRMQTDGSALEQKRGFIDYWKIFNNSLIK